MRITFGIKEKIMVILGSMETGNENTLNYSRLESILYHLAVFFVLAALVTALIVLPQWFVFPFIGPKVWFFRSMVIAAAVCIVPLVLTNASFRYGFTILHSAVILYLFAIILSAIFGVDFYRSWWSGHERMLGIFSVVHYAAYFFMLPVLFRGWKGHQEGDFKFVGWEFFFRILVIIATIVGVIGLAQRWTDGFLFVEGGGRVFSTLGNFIYLGNFMTTSLFIIALLFWRTNSRNWRIALSIMAGINFLAFIFSGSRGALVGLIAGVGATLLFASSMTSGKVRKWAFLSTLAIAAISVLIFFTPVSDYLQTVRPVSRLVNLRADSTPRLITWGVAIDAWRERPLMGWGFENFYIAFNKHFNPKSLEFSFYETWFDNAHNIFLNNLTSVGVIGTLAYILIYIAAFRVLYKGRQKTGNDSLAIYLAAGVLFTDLFSKIFVFDHAVSYIILFVILAFIVRVKPGRINERKLEKPRPKSLKFISIISLVIGILFIFQTNVLPAYANSRTLKAMRTLHSQPNQAMHEIDVVLNLKTAHLVDIRMDVAKEVRSSGRFLQAQIGEEAYAKLLAKVLQGLDEAHAISPKDIQIVIMQAQISSILVSDELRDYAESKMKYAIELSPDRQQLYYMFARMKAEREDYEGSVELLDQAIKINPKIGFSYWLRAFINYKAGNKDTVLDDIITSTETYLFVPQSTQEIDFTSAILAEYDLPNLGYDEELLKKYREVGQNPAPQLLIRMAKSYDVVGLHSKANETALRLTSLYPDLEAEVKDQLKIPETAISISLLEDQVESYKSRNLRLPMWLHESRIFYYTLEGDEENLSLSLKEGLQDYSDTLNYFNMFVECTRDLRPAHLPRVCATKRVQVLMGNRVN